MIDMIMSGGYFSLENIEDILEFSLIQIQEEVINNCTYVIIEENIRYNSMCIYFIS